MTFAWIPGWLALCRPSGVRQCRHCFCFGWMLSGRFQTSTLLFGGVKQSGQQFSLNVLLCAIGRHFFCLLFHCCELPLAADRSVYLMVTLLIPLRFGGQNLMVFLKSLLAVLCQVQVSSVFRSVVISDPKGISDLFHGV